MGSRTDAGRGPVLSATVPTAATAARTNGADASASAFAAGPGERVREIDLLRFLAAMMVVFFHYAFRGHAANGYSDLAYPELAPLAKYGYLGVELFFLISGFVILMTASSGSLSKFAVSRIVRLYPAYWACCTLTFIAILCWGQGRFEASFAQYLANLGMLNEFVGVPSIDGVYWSLAVELKFYFLVALLLVFRQIDRAQWFLALWLALTLLLDLFPLDRLRSWLIVDSAPYFIGGALCYLIHARGLSLARAGLLAVAWLAGLAHSLAALAGVSRVFRNDFQPAPVAIAVTLFFAIMLMIALRRTGGLGRRDWLTVGALTYPLYLIHQYLGYMIFNLGYPTVNRHVLFWGTILLMLALAYAVNRWVERRYARAFKRALENLLPFGERSRHNQPT